MTRTKEQKTIERRHNRLMNLRDSTPRNAILDSSDRHENIVLKERWSVHEEWAIGGNIVYSVSEVTP
jgi:hypothetical protein